MLFQLAKELVHKIYLKVCCGKSSWHRRFYDPSVKVVRSAECIWFEHEDVVLKTLNASSLKSKFQGRCNVLLSGPSVLELKDTAKLQSSSLMAVNGSLGIYGEKPLPRIQFYHVNDTSYIRDRTEDFLKYANTAELTIIDIRAIFLLFKLGLTHRIQSQLVVFDNWGWPYVNDLTDIPRISEQPCLKGIYLSTDLSLGLANAGTVAYTAAQLLWQMGFSSVYFYGLDLNSKGRSYKEGSDAPKQKLDYAYERTIKPAFQLLVNQTKSEPIEFVNCNLNSRLPESILKKVDINASFDTT